MRRFIRILAASPITLALAFAAAPGPGPDAWAAEPAPAADTAGSPAAPPLGARGVRVVAGPAGGWGRPEVAVAASWLRSERRAVLSRELQTAAAGGRTVRVRDLVHRQVRQVLGLRGEVGLFRDLSLSVELPVVLADDRSLEFDRRDPSCERLTGAGAAGASPACVNETTSTLLRDGILPGAGMASYGLDARTGQPFARPSRRVFRGPTRRGVEYVGVGLGLAIMNQRRDPSLPTWIVRFEPRFAAGAQMTFDPADPEGNRSVNPGYHQLLLSTLFSRRFLHLQPSIGAYYALPFTPGGSPFADFPLGRKGFSSPQHQTGVDAALELVAHEVPGSGHKVTVELRAGMDLRFFGLARSELWEVLSGSSACPGTPGACRPGVDVDLDGDGRPQPYPGIVRSPSYGLFRGTLAVNVQIAGLVFLRAVGGGSLEQDHFLSDGRSGVDSFDLPGRRYWVEDAYGWRAGLEASVGF